MPTETKEHLLPCPFCGNDAITSTYYIECSNRDGSCHIEPKLNCFGDADTQTKIDQWNQRAGDKNVNRT